MKSRPVDSTDPIAIVGIGCRYADTRGPAEFWELVRSGRNTVRDVPQHRIDLGYDIDHFYDPRPRIPGKISSKKGGFLEHPELFDPAAFGIAPRDALTMEPQQRLMIEVAWDALEDAGIVPDSIVGERVAVMLGYMAEDYSRERTGVLGEAAVFRGHDVFTVGGMSHAVLSGRISFLLGLTGPSFTLDTACSSSLITTHLACQSLRRGEADMALAGGVNLFLSPEGNIALSRSGMLSKSGACKAFDASADGFVRAEGAGIVVLRPLADAIDAGNPIYAVIRGSGISTDGRDGGHMMAPGRNGQMQAMRDAYAEAGVSPSDVHFVETHGTGTMIGDPVEIAALAEVMGPGRAPDRPLRVASVKGNLGHTESASGVAGLIKASLAIRHGVLPAQLHFETPNPAIPWDDIPVRVQSETTPWPYPGPKLVGVNSFGISGTNAHIVLESPPLPKPTATFRPSERRPVLVPITGHDANALHDMVENQNDALLNRPRIEIQDLAYTLSQRRTHRSHRLCVVSSSIDEMRTELDAYLADRPSAAVQTGTATLTQRPKIVMVFPGQGSQWAGMGRGLIDHEPAFARSIDEIDAAYRQHVNWSLRDVLMGSEGIDWTARLDVLQPVLVAMEIALAALWESWGIRPDRVLGQSMGEIAAAYVAGGLRLEDVAQLACHRGQIVARAAGVGTMAVVSLPRARVEEDLESVAGRAEVAGSNSPTTTIVSGDRDAVVSLVEHWTSLDIFARQLEVDFASHCFHMDPLLDAFRAGVEGIKPTTLRIPFDSTVDESEKTAEDLDVDYWIRNLRQPVAFDSGLTRSIEAGAEILLEVSPHATLLRASTEIADELKRSVTHVSSLQRDQDEQQSMLTSLGALFTQGVAVDFEAVQPGGKVVETPLYSYQRKRFWFSERNRSHNFRPTHPLLGARSESSIDPRMQSWDFVLDEDSGGFIQDYRVAGQRGAPSALFPELALAVAEEMWPGRAVSIRNLELVRPLELGRAGRRLMQASLVVDGDSKCTGELRVSSREDGRANWALHATCRLELSESDRPGRGGEMLDRTGARPIPASVHLESLDRCGLSLGPKCRALRDLECAEEEAEDRGSLIARMMLPRLCESEWHAYRAHPAILESCFQLVGTQLESAAAVRVRSIDEIWFSGALGSDCWCRITSRPDAVAHSTTSPIAVADLEFFDRDGKRIGWIDGLRAEALPEVNSARESSTDTLYRVDWTLVEAPQRSGQREVKQWIIVSDAEEEAAMLAAELQKVGATCSFCEKVEDLAPLVARLSADRASAWGLVVLAWSTPGKAIPLEDPSHRTFRIASWASAVREYCGDASQVWLATRGLQSVCPGDRESTETGRLIAREIDTFATYAEMLQCRVFDSSDRLEHAERVALASIMGCDGEDRQFSARDNALFVPRLNAIASSDTAKSSSVRRTKTPAGDRNFRAIHGGSDGLDCLLLQEVSEPEPELTPESLLIEVRSAALSQLDVLTGQGLARAPDRGMNGVAQDFSGVVRAVGDSDSNFKVGDEVIGVHHGALARRLIISSAYVAPKPSFFDFHEAASIPFPFLVARYALQVVARLRAGERVLILSASGGVGQALIQIARSVGAEVNATASSARRRAVLRELGARVVEFSSQSERSNAASSTDFGDFDVIVSADAGPRMHAMLARLAAGGRYIDLCPRASFERPELGALRLGANRSVSAIDVHEMMRTEPTLVSALLEQTAEDAKQGRVQPIATTLFPVGEAARALRFMAQNRHVGRVCVNLEQAHQTPISAASKKQSTLSGRGAFAVTGNDLESTTFIADWLGEQGVRHVERLDAQSLTDAHVVVDRAGDRLGGWIHVAREDDGDEQGVRVLPAVLDAEFFALISVRESVGSDPGRNRAWEARLTVDRMLLSNLGAGCRFINISVDAGIPQTRLVEVLERALAGELDESQVVMLSDADLSSRLADAPSPLLAQLRHESEGRMRSELLRAEMLSMSPPERRSSMQRFVCDTLAGVLSLSEEQRLGLDVGSQLDAVGLDSLMTMEFFIGMGRDLELEVAADWFSTSPSLSDISAVLIEQLELAGQAGLST